MKKAKERKPKYYLKTTGYTYYVGVHNEVSIYVTGDQNDAFTVMRELNNAYELGRKDAESEMEARTNAVMDKYGI